MDFQKNWLDRAGENARASIEPCTPSTQSLSDVFCTAGFQAAEGGVEDFLIAKSFCSWNEKLGPALEGFSEGIHLQGVGFRIGDGGRVGFVALALAEFDGMIDGQAILGLQCAGLANNFEGCAVVGASGNQDDAESAAGELKGNRRGGFDGAGAIVRDSAGCNTNDFVLQDEPQRVDAVHADIGDRTTSGKRWVGEPNAAVILRRVTEFGAGVDGAADGTGGDLIAKPTGAVLEAEYLRDTEKKFGGPGGFDHLAAFASVHSHRLFAEHRLAMGERGERIRQMQRVRRGDENGINFGGGAEFGDGVEGERDLILGGGSAGFLDISTLQRGDL